MMLSLWKERLTYFCMGAAFMAFVSAIVAHCT